LIDRLPLPIVVAELGSGTGKKTRLILEALSGRQPVTYFPIDISRAALDRCEQDLSRIRAVSVVGFERAYLDGLLEVAARRNPREQMLVLFLGSNIGNFDRPAGLEFLREVRRILRPGDSLLLSADLEKPVPQLLLAYDDPIGATAAFNLNLLARINRELDANFDLSKFQHVVRYNENERRVEMHLRSTEDQIVHIRRASCAFSFRKDETIWTENSQKFNRDEIVEMAQRSGFRCETQWIDLEWPFSQNLLIAV
jgi:dimethylhistidine N-methyltransferase